MSRKGKLYQKATQGLRNHQKHDGDDKDSVKFVEYAESKEKAFAWKSIARNIGPLSSHIFKTPVILNGWMAQMSAT